MDHRGIGLFVGTLFEGLLALFLAPFRLLAWALREDDPAAEVDAVAQAYRDAAAEADASEREPAPRETLAQAMRQYLRREKKLSDLHGFGPDASAWALAARYENLGESDVPRDDATFETDVLAARLVSPGAMHDMRRALARFADLPALASKPTLPVFADAATAPAAARWRSSIPSPH